MNTLTKTLLITTALLATTGAAVAVAGSSHGKGNGDHSAGTSHDMDSGKHMMEQHEHGKGQVGLLNQGADSTSKRQTHQHGQEHHAVTDSL